MDKNKDMTNENLRKAQEKFEASRRAKEAEKAKQK